LGAAHAAALNYWRFEEGNGGYVADEVGGITGGLVGNGGWPWSAEVPAATVPLTGAANNGSLYCGGVWLDITTPQTMALGPEFTIEFFFNAVEPVISSTFFGLANGSFLDAALSDGPDYMLGLYFGSNLEITSADLVTINEWHHFALTKTPGAFSVFIDGALQGGGSLPSSTDGPYVFGGSAVRDGSRNIGNGFSGYLDEFRISDMALTPSQFLNASIPEPSALGLMLLGAAGLAWRRRRK
jgi:hypothetical protein